MQVFCMIGLEAYARSKGIEVRRYTPNFRKKKLSDFKSVIVVGKKVGEERDEEIADEMKVYDGTYTTGEIVKPKKITDIL